MKFFTHGLIFIDEPKSETEEKEQLALFRAAEKKRAVEFNKAKRSMSLKSLEIYQNNEHFHDYSIKEIVINKNTKSRVTPLTEIIIILDGKQSIALRYTSVTLFEIASRCDDTHAIMVSKWEGKFDDYLYDEFFDLGDSTYSHEILMLTGSTVKIYYKRLIIGKQKNA